jgi:hypothetical protein
MAAISGVSSQPSVAALLLDEPELDGFTGSMRGFVASMLVAVGLTGCCGPPYHPSWQPPLSVGETAVVRFEGEQASPPRTEVGMLYSEIDGVRGADYRVLLWSDGTWQLSLQDNEQRGPNHREIATGLVDGDGVLVDLPDSFIRGAIGVWCRTGDSFTIDDEPVPDQSN